MGKHIEVAALLGLDDSVHGRARHAGFFGGLGKPAWGIEPQTCSLRVSRSAI